MKKLPLLAAVAILMASACTKISPDSFRGNYSFKTSGYVTAVDAEDSKVTVAIPTESGQMDITPTGKDGRFLITMNATAGDLTVYYGNFVEDRLYLEPATRHFPILGNSEVTVTGYGEKFNNIVLFTLEYNGSVTVDETEYTIIGSEINCRAKINEK